MAANQHPEQVARDRIDARLKAAGWQLQHRDSMNVFGALGVAVTELQTTEGPADYTLFVDGQPVGVIEAKRENEAVRLTTHEDQTERYRTSPIKLLGNDAPLRFGYESTGELTRFTDALDPRPRSRPVFSFHKPETLRQWLGESKSLRARLHDIPPLDPAQLRDCQFRAINKLEASFCDAKPRALIQMATGAGKTFTAITSIYRLLKFANAKRILFLVDTRNLGEQAEQEFLAFQPSDDNRKFDDLYNVNRLTSRLVPSNSHVCISTIQRMYSILRGQDLALEDEERNPAERSLPREPMPVEYNPDLPPELFDFVIIDECHRSIYNLWKQVLEYFDAFQIGLTATPDKRTYAYFHENVVSEYPYEQSVVDGVNVGYDIYRIETQITQSGAVIRKDEGFIELREKLTRRKRWEQQDEDTHYDAKRLDRDVVNPSQIRTVIRTFKERLPVLFPGRSGDEGLPEVPKTLIFAKDDSHADDIVQIVREEFGESNAFCKKVTYKATEDPKTILANLRNDYNPRIAVTVDMIATGTDVKPLECLIFMRDVRSRSYFEQMKGRGCRSLASDDLLKVTPKASLGKGGFIIVDAVGVTQSIKTDSRPLERKRNVPLRDEHKVPETADPAPEQLEATQKRLAREVARSLTPEVRDFIENARKALEQIVDTQNPDTLLTAEWDTESVANAEKVITDFRAYIEAHKDEITALRIYYDQPYRLRELTYAMIREVLDRLKADRPALAPARVWSAFNQIEESPRTAPKNELVALVSLLRRIVGLDERLTDAGALVRQRFQEWVFKRHAGNAPKFTEEQMAWLRMIAEHIATSFHVAKDDLELAPFDARGGLGRFYQLFGSDYQAILDELNERLVA